MIKIAIIDDNQFYIDDVKRLLSETAEMVNYEVFEYSSEDSFLKDIEIIQFDIVFLDIVLGNTDGIELGLVINEKQPAANIIFVSSYSEYFKDVYKVSHSYFLTKEFEKERFFDAICKVMKNIRRDAITVRVKNDTYRIMLSDVMYFEGYLKRTRLNMSDGGMVEYNINIRDIAKLLPEDYFLRTHQSYIVNMKYIKKYSRLSILMTSGKNVPISRTYINSAKEKITLFLGGSI